MNIVRCGLLLIFVSTLSSVSQAKTVWPPFMPSLMPAFSNSRTEAVLPADTLIAAPANTLSAGKLRWHNTWLGWGCRYASCDVKIAVERVTHDRASIVYARGDDRLGHVVERGEGRFVDDELHVALSSGASLALRFRDTGVMEMLGWTANGRLDIAGVLTEKTSTYTRSFSRVPTPWQQDDKALTLELVTFKPGGAGPFPTVIFNHGSTGSGDNPKIAKITWTDRVLTEFYTRRGWQVMFPQRRGRGKSDGVYDEGFTPSHSHYSCDPERSIAGLDRAVEDLDAVVKHLNTLASVDQQRLLIGGVSRGGILSVVYAGQRPKLFRGVVNFVGGWMGDRCKNVAQINPVLFRRGAAFKSTTLWLYGQNDPFYSISHSRSNFDAFVQAGGQGTFLVFDLPKGRNGHYIHADKSFWQAAMGQYLKTVERD